MNIVGKLAVTCFATFALSTAAVASVTVNSPANNSDVSSPFTLSASASNCASKSVVSMGYSFDSSSDTTVVHNQSIDQAVAVSAGAHTLHVKAWAGNGISCVTDVKITVQAGADNGGSGDSANAVVPPYADSVSNIQALSGWQAKHDTGASGSSSGSTSIVSSPSLYGSTRRFISSFSSNGDQRFSVVFSDNTVATNYFYDGWIYLTSSASKIGNIEMDLNQVMPNGQTAMMGFQCDGYSGNWAYNVNLGSASSFRPHWQSMSGTTCNPRNWTRNTWHHVQASLSRDDTGHVTYHSIWLDGKETKMNVLAFVADNNHWGPVIQTQFQLDGLGSGTVTVYLDDLTISMW